MWCLTVSDGHCDCTRHQANVDGNEAASKTDPERTEGSKLVQHEQNHSKFIQNELMNQNSNLVQNEQLSKHSELVKNQNTEMKWVETTWLFDTREDAHVMSPHVLTQLG